MFRSVLFLVLLLATLLPPSNAGRRLVGGYGPIEDLEDPMVVNAAKFALLELFDKAPYNFLEEIEGDEEAFVPMVVEGSQQVVAGLNLKLTLMIQKVNEITGEALCQGAMEVQLYLKLDETMEVTEWGDELTCDQAQVLLEDRLMNEQKKKVEIRVDYGN